MSDSEPYGVTLDHQGNPTPKGEAAPAEHLPRIGRYRFEKLLGKVMTSSSP